MVVDDGVVVEVKSTTRLSPEDHRQVINFLRATRWEVGLLLHFGPKPFFYRFVSSNDDPLKYGGVQSYYLFHAARTLRTNTIACNSPSSASRLA
jgi:hypothetical protein